MFKPDLHPSVEELTAFSGGQLPIAEAEIVESHIGECTQCCETLMGLATDDAFVGLLRAARDPGNGVSFDVKMHAKTAGLGVGPIALAEHPRYEIVELIAKGGMGEVLKAKHRMMDRTVALKVIKKQLMRNSEVVDRFHREVKMAAHLSHPNIVRPYDAEHAEGIHFLVMEHVDGINLADLVKRDGSLSVAEACEYARQAATGLQHAHESGMVHRDIKPHNLMLASDGIVRILDFGLASLASTSVSLGAAELPEQSSLTADGTIMGTPDFISPEQATDAGQADIRSDIYSLGATLHYLLSAQPPFPDGSVTDKLKCHVVAEPNSMRSLRQDVPQELSDIISNMLSKDPARRFQTPQAVADALARFINQHQSAAVAEFADSTTQGKSWWSAPKLTAAASAAVAMVLACVIYLETDKGTLVIESVAENVNVTISKVAVPRGKESLQLSVVDTVTGTKVVRLPSGDYKVTLGEERNDYETNQERFTLRRGGEVVLQVTRKEGSSAVSEASPLVPMPIPRMAQLTFMMQGTKLSGEAAQELQIKAADDPADLESRLQLLGYYHRRSILEVAMREPYTKLVSWFVKKYPEAETAGNPNTQIHAGIDPSGYMKVKTLWLEKVEAYPRNTKILSNAAKFFLQSDRSVAEELLKTAQTIEPENASWAEQLGQLYRLGLIRVSSDQRQKQASKALEQFELAMSQNETPQKMSTLLVELTKTAFEAGAPEKAKAYANQLLNIGGGDEQGWNSGNAIHHANLTLGRLALQAGNIKEASADLQAAGKTSGSPQLNSFGPNMLLAKELLEKGETEVVLEYLELCGKFWKSDDLKQWSATVKAGGMPQFGGNLSY